MASCKDARITIMLNQAGNAQATKEPAQTYIPALDGLRALAIIWVMLHNGAIDSALNMDTIFGKLFTLLIDMGWLGVQLFFVLSGFLITGILLDAKKNQLKNLYKHFYIRRTLRIFPVYYAFLFTAFVLAIVLTDITPWLQTAYEHKWWHIFYLNNWIQPFQAVGFSHLWSLAIEEQFYIFWPLVVIGLTFRRLYLVCFIIILFSVLFKVSLVNYDLEFAKTAAYVLTPARLDALALGSLLSVMLRDPAISFRLPKIILITAGAASAYIIVTLLTRHSFDAVSAGWSILNQSVAAVLFFTLVYYCANKDNRDKFSMQILSLAWVRAIGKRSYAMYIFHLPVSLLLHGYLKDNLMLWFSFAGDNTEILVFTADLLLLFIITYVLALYSWWLIERPFLNLKRYFPMSNQ